MNPRLETIVQTLRKGPSAEAAAWLIAHFPAGSPQVGDALQILSHLSLKRGDQMKLARHYLRNLPFASARPYEAFAALMTTRRFLAVLEENLPEPGPDRQLLAYHLKSVFAQPARTALDQKAIEAFMADLQTDNA